MMHENNGASNVIPWFWSFGEYLAVSSLGWDGIDVMSVYQPNQVLPLHSDRLRKGLLKILSTPRHHFPFHVATKHVDLSQG